MNASRARTVRSPVAHDFTWPLTVPGGEIAGAEVVRELPADIALTVWQALRSVLLWAGQPEDARAGLFEPASMRAWEAELLRGPLEAPLRDPLAVIVDELATPGEASESDLSWACMCVAEWCLGRGAVSTALAFAEACALCWPEHARYAWFAGRLLRRHGRLKEAEQWIRRAIRIAVSTGDADTHTLGMNSLGNVYYEQGNYPSAVKTLRDALRLARRHRLARREGEIFHDLFAATLSAGDHGRAELYARRAYEAYRDGHHRLPALAHDVAAFWIQLGHCTLALPVLKQLPPHFDLPEERVRVLASLARAAGACGDGQVFANAWDEVWSLAGQSRTSRNAAPAMLEVGYAASSLERWDMAERALVRAIEIAAQTGAADVTIRAEAALLSVRDRYSLDDSITSDSTRMEPATGTLADGFLNALRNVEVECSV